MFGNLLNSYLHNAATGLHAYPQAVQQIVGQAVGGFGKALAGATGANNFTNKLQLAGSVFNPQQAKAADTSYYTNPNNPVNTGPVGIGQGTPAVGTPVSGGGSGGGGGGSTTQANLVAPTYNNPDTSTVDADIAAWQAARAGLLAEEPQLDTSYTQGKQDIQDTIDSAQKAADLQKQTNEADYGNLLQKNLQTYQDMGRQTQGIFSNLGSLEGSDFENQQLKNDQLYGKNVADTNAEKLRVNTGIENTLTDYVNKANSSLATLANTYQTGKNQLAQLIAQGDIAGAQSVAQALADVRQKAADINNSIQAFQNQANLYKTLGYNVNSSIPGYNMTGYGSNMTNSLSAAQTALGNLVPASSSTQTVQSWYYDPTTGKKIDRTTGQVIG